MQIAWAIARVQHVAAVQVVVAAIAVVVVVVVVADVVVAVAGASTFACGRLQIKNALSFY